MTAVVAPNPILAPGASIRAQFPIFAAPGDRRLVYLDTAASSQKPAVVIDRLTHYLSNEHANIHRGAYRLSAEATNNYELARARVAGLVRAGDEFSVVFTRSTTESINLVAYGIEHLLSEGDVILLTLLEHHSNIVPWQLLAKRKRLKIIFADMEDDGSLNIEDFKIKLAKHRPKLVGMTHVSNAFGSVLPIESLIPLAKEAGSMVLVDAAQSIPHMPVSAASLGADFYAFSAHKVYGPTGIGILVGRTSLLELMEPFQGGGGMIRKVEQQESSWAEVPHKYEAGTPPIGEAIATGTAMEFLENIGYQAIEEHDTRLFNLAFEKLVKEKGVTVYGPATSGTEQSSIVAFNVDNVHPHDLASIADQFNVQFRAGHHCAMPALARLGLQSTARISFGVYSVEDDVTELIEALRHARKIFNR